MLSRYKIYRGKRPPGEPQPNGIRQDCRWRTRHPLRPTKELVDQFLASPRDDTWRRYAKDYMALIERRFAENRTPYDDLSELAKKNDVYLGCSCPTKANPQAGHCHTLMALRFMKKKYPSLTVKAPAV